MSAETDIPDLLVALEEGDAWEVGCRFFAAHGFDSLVCGLLDASDDTLVAMRTNVRADFVDHYATEGYGAVDPWIAHSMRAGGRFTYRHEDDATRRAGTPLAALADERAQAARTALLDEQAEAGLRNAVYVPVGGTRLRGGLNVGTSLAERDFEAVTAEKGAMLETAAALVVHELKRSFRDAYGARAPGDPLAWQAEAKAALPPREREALTWLASGLRNDRIAERIGIAAVTVNVHLASARRRLGARTREEAVAIAMRRGLIAP